MSLNNTIKVGCFEKAPNGSDIIDLDQDVPPRTQELIFHRVVSNSISLSAILLNGLLLWMVRNKSKRLQAMTPLFCGSATLDMLLATTNFMLTPIAINSYGYVFGFSNAAWTVNLPLYHRLMSGLNGGLTVSVWNCVPVGFLYRLYVVKCGHRPTSHWLFIFGSTALLICIICISSSYSVYFFTNDEFQSQSSLIVRHMGYKVDSFTLFGSSDLLAVTIYRKFVVLYGTISGLCLIAIIQLYLQWSLMTQTKKMSPITKRMHTELNFFIIALAMSPLLTNLTPAITTTLILKNCAPMQWFHITRSFVASLPSLLNPLTTILFVQPYRRAIFSLFRDKLLKSEVSSVGAITVPSGPSKVKYNNLI